MLKYGFDVRFNYESGLITLHFESRGHARAYKEETGSRCRLSKDNYKIELPHLSGLDYIRCSDATHDFIFGFSSEKEAIRWKEDLPLVSRNGKEVKIARVRGSKLDEVLRVRRIREDGDGDGDVYKARGSHPMWRFSH